MNKSERIKTNMRLVTREEYERTDSLAVFAYGSLLWCPKFTFHKSTPGLVYGFDIKFWQKNTFHRGTPKKPGRCATLTPNPNSNGVVYGKMYQVLGKENVKNALDHLFTREVVLGNYKVFEVNFYDFNSYFQMAANKCNDLFSTNYDPNQKVLVFIATCSNPQFDNKQPTSKIAHEIYKAKGHCGSNVEYLNRVVDYWNVTVHDRQKLLDATKLFIRKIKNHSNFDDYYEILKNFIGIVEDELTGAYENFYHLKDIHLNMVIYCLKNKRGDPKLPIPTSFRAAI
ncbi:hypothetical protein SNEBB_006863 [Seison nebaliae]|nr:hypothetical protein SNEBB_006863 [Seison nebaliae]